MALFSTLFRELFFKDKRHSSTLRWLFMGQGGCFVDRIGVSTFVDGWLSLEEGSMDVEWISTAHFCLAISLRNSKNASLVGNCTLYLISELLNQSIPFHFHCFLNPLSNGNTSIKSVAPPNSNLLNNLLLPKYPPYRHSQPLPRHPHPTSISITNPSYKNRICRWDFLFLHFLRGLAVAVFLGCYFGGGDFAAAFGSLFFEEAVYRVHLLGGRG